MTNADRLPAPLLQRKAVVYVRQSTQAQAQMNLESQRRQYELVGEAKRRGFRDIEVIDDDLGRSASGTVARPGFERLVALLCAGEVGAVLCLDASRLARNGRAWHHLRELCGIVEARVIDLDGVYDPCRPNDRLLLGMKGRNETLNNTCDGVERIRGDYQQPAAAGAQTQVSLTSGSSRAVADIAVNGPPNGAVQLPPGFVAEDINGVPLVDAAGKPITSIRLNPQGQAIFEVKTGNATTTSNQRSVYPSVQAGMGAGTGAGTNAARANMSGPLPPTPVIVLRRPPSQKF